MSNDINTGEAALEELWDLFDHRRILTHRDLPEGHDEIAFNDAEQRRVLRELVQNATGRVILRLARELEGK